METDEIINSGTANSETANSETTNKDPVDYCCLSFSAIGLMLIVALCTTCGALIGTLLAESLSCCLAARDCWTKTPGYLWNGPCLGSINFTKLNWYRYQCSLQQQPLVEYYAGIGAIVGSIMVMCILLGWVIFYLFSNTRIGLIFKYLVCCGCCPRSGYSRLLETKVDPFEV